jgi:hypothetical protein
MACSSPPVCVVAALLIAMPVAAQQDPTRGRLAGWVAGGDGKRVAGADVVLLAQPFPGRPELAAGDEVRARTGADGMFRAELLPGRAYTAWATWRDAAGVERRTALLEGVIPGPPRGLAEAPLQTLRAVRITGAEAWRDRMPLSLAAYPAGENAAAVPLAPDGALRAALPVLPGPSCKVEVRGADGALLGAAPWLDLDGAAAEATIELPPPGPLRVVVTDAAGAPVAGALVRHHFGLHHRRDVSHALGRTGAQGALEASVPRRNPMYGQEANETFALIVEAAGMQRTIVFRDRAKEPGEVRVALRVGVELRGRVLGAGGAAVAGITVLPECYAVGSDAETTGMGVPTRAVPLDAGGSFAFTSLHPRYDFRVLALLEPAAARAAGMALKPDVPLAPVLWLATGAPPFATPHDLGELRLDRLPVAQVAVRTATGEPVPGARLELTTPSLYNSPLSYVCDRVGRLQLPLPAGGLRIGAWAPGGGVATRLLRSAEVPELDPFAIALSPTRTVRGIVVDAAGKPVAGIRVHQWDRARCDDRDLAELTFHVRSASEPTGADGRFELTLPLADAVFAVRAFGDAGGVRLLSDEVVADPSDPAELRVAVAPFVPKR